MIYNSIALVCLQVTYSVVLAYVCVDGFKDLLCENPECLLLFSECQKAGVSFPNKTKSSHISNQTNGHSNGHSNGHAINGTQSEQAFISHSS